MSSDVPHQKKSVRKTTPVNPFVTLRYGPKQWLVNSVLSTIYEKQWLVTLVLSTIYEKRERPKVRVGPCCARAVRLLVLQLQHQFAPSPNHAVAVAETVTLNFPLGSPERVAPMSNPMKFGKTRP